MNSLSIKRSPLKYFLLVYAFSIPFWTIGTMVKVEGLPLNIPVTDVFASPVLPILLRVYIAVIKALASKGKGLTRTEIIDTCGLSSEGTATRLLEELVESGFISPNIPFDKKIKESIYKLSDEYSLLYLKFMEKTRSTGVGTRLRLANSSHGKAGVVLHLRVFV